MPLYNPGTKLDPADAPTFRQSPHSQPVKGPRTLYRFGSETGKWWYDKSLLDEMKEDFYEITLGEERVKNPAGVILGNPRGGLAVSQDWNKFVWLCTLTLSAADVVECWIGETAAQPEWQTKPDGRVLHGGLTQYLIYDATKIPPRLIAKQSVASLWRQLSQTIALLNGSAAEQRSPRLRLEARRRSGAHEAPRRFPWRSSHARMRATASSSAPRLAA
jgi:hypothetical protein